MTTQTKAQRLADEFAAIKHPTKDYARVILVKRSGSAPPLSQDEELLLALHAENIQLRAELEAVRRDAERVDAPSTPGWELSMSNDPECMPHELWQVHRVSGGRNDREWTLIGQGQTPRAAIDAAQAERAEGVV